MLNEKTTYTAEEIEAMDSIRDLAMEAKYGIDGKFNCARMLGVEALKAVLGLELAIDADAYEWEGFEETLFRMQADEKFGYMVIKLNGFESFEDVENMDWFWENQELGNFEYMAAAAKVLGKTQTFKKFIKKGLSEVEHVPGEAELKCLDFLRENNIFWSSSESNLFKRMKASWEKQGKIQQEIVVSDGGDEVGVVFYKVDNKVYVEINVNLIRGYSIHWESNVKYFGFKDILRCLKLGFKAINTDWGITDRDGDHKALIVR